MSDKKSGSYYTPVPTVTFMCKYIRANCPEFKGAILEPSAGDGRFLKVLADKFNGLPITGVELDAQKVQFMRRDIKKNNIILVQSDFLAYAESCVDRFGLVIGNPPYISVKNMGRAFLENARQLCRKFDLSTSLAKNAWVAFLLASLELLAPGGTVFFVLPMEFLQVQYAEKLREFLEMRFNTIHIFTFEEKMFPDIEQNTCLVYLANDEALPPSISYERFDTLEGRFCLNRSQIKRNKPLPKWTNAVLSDDEIDLLQKASALFPRISDLAVSAPGIVTGANKIFILTEDEVQRYKCLNFVKPVISKGAMVRNHFEIDQGLLYSLSKAGEKVYVLDLTGVTEEEMSGELREYLEQSAKIERNHIEVQRSYKCSHRKPWYAVPMVKSGPVVFFKRYGKIPRMSTNPEKMLTTDIAYNLQPNANIHPASLVFCFYNSLTMALCEYAGRYYAGGVAELVPSEFKQLRVPYEKISEKDIEHLDEMFRQERTLDAITTFVDGRILSHRLAQDDVTLLRRILRKLTERRRM